MKAAVGSKQRLPSTTLLLAVVWFLSCSLLVSLKQQALAPVFYAFIGAFAVQYAVSAILRGLLTFDKRRERETTAVLNWALTAIHAVAVLVLRGRESLVATAGYCLFDLWDKAANGLFGSAAAACELAHHTLLPIWYISALYKEAAVPLQLYAAPVAVSSLVLSAGAIRRQLATPCDPPSALHTWLFLGLRCAGYGKLALSAARAHPATAGMGRLGLGFALALNVLSIVTAAALLPRRRAAATASKAVAVVPAPAPPAADAPAADSTAAAAAAAADGDADAAETPPSLWRVHGRLYNLAPFVARHPGGVAAISLGRGRDCTALFESYHPFTDAHRAALARYRVAGGSGGGSSSSGSGSSGDAVPSREEADPLYAELCARVREVLEDAGLDPRGVGQRGRDGRLRRGGIKASPARVAHYTAAAAALAAVYVPFATGRWGLGGPLALALAAWLCGAAGHDGGHYAAARGARANAAAAALIAPLASPFLWAQQHTYAHHAHTNDARRDPDLHHFGWLRTTPRAPWAPRHRAQARRAYVYAWYALVVVGEALWLPLKLLATGDINGVTPVPGAAAPRARAAQALHVALYAALFVAAPLRCGGGPVAVVVFLAASGLLFGFFSQVNHLNERSVPPSGGGGAAPAPASWAEGQIVASNNFCTGSAFWTVLSNGLNFQIEHHLFPGVNHAHLWRVAPAVRAVCAARGVEYKSFGSFREILAETARFYRLLSVEDGQT